MPWRKGWESSPPGGAWRHPPGLKPGRPTRDVSPPWTLCSLLGLREQGGEVVFVGVVREITDVEFVTHSALCASYRCSLETRRARSGMLSFTGAGGTRGRTLVSILTRARRRGVCFLFNRASIAESRLSQRSWSSGIGRPAKSGRQALAIQRAQRAERLTRALSVAIPVFAYICR